MIRWSCLMYHEIPAAAGDPGDGYFAVPAARFAEQMARLHDGGFRGVSLEQAVEAGRPEEVAITFDDGHASNFSAAVPILVRHGFRATFFVTTSWVGTPDRVTWSQLGEMSTAGMSIQSHTDTHQLLSSLDTSAVRLELETSKARLDQALNQETTSLALPGGDFPRREQRGLITGAGYRILATSQWGPNPFPAPDWGGAKLIQRYTVRRGTADARFEQMYRARSGAASPEGLRLQSLSYIRSLIGTERYGRWRRTALGLLGR